MTKSILEKYYQKGWLKCGSQKISAEERLFAGYVFYKSYVLSHVLSVGVIDFEKPHVDGGLRFNPVEGKFLLRDKFLKAYRTIDISCRQIVQTVVLENKALAVSKNDLPLVKAMLCAGLDGLVSYYISESKNDQK